MVQRFKMMPISELPLGIFPSEQQKMEETQRRSQIMRSSGSVRSGRKTLDEASRKFSGMFVDKWATVQGRLIIKNFFMCRSFFFSL